VDEHVEGVPVRSDALDDGPDPGGAREVASDDPRLAAEGPHGRGDALRLLRVPKGVDGDVRPSLGEPQRRRGADPATPTGHERPHAGSDACRTITPARAAAGPPRVKYRAPGRPPMTTSDPPLVRLERRGAVAVLTIDHPPVNVLNAAVLDALVARLAEVDADRSLRAVVLCGAAEKAFAAGADIREMAPMGPGQARRHGARGQGATVAIERISLPVIAAVHGSCLGGGCELALACDFVVASEDARFGQPEVNLGVMPGWGGTQRLPRRIGAAQARYWIYTGRSMTAADAMAQGWVLAVVPKARLLEEAIGLAEELAEKSADALAAAKYAVQRAVDRGLTEGLAYELRIWESLFATTDQKEGMRAFLEKRTWKPTERDPASPVPQVAGVYVRHAGTPESGKGKN
jgi:enoyl-CoA hydratase/carnithine racemase